MLRCCMHCIHAGHFIHESGWSCEKHDFWVSLNNMDSLEKVFDCTPAGIIKTLNLKQPIYRKTASYGHFGRDGFPWENTDKVEALKSAIN